MSTTSTSSAKGRPLGLNLVDHHVHLFSEAARQRLEAEIGRRLPRFTATELVPALERDEVEKAVVLSAAYSFARSDGPCPPSPEGVSAENDWVGNEVSKHPDWLVGFFSVNPLDESSFREIERCAQSGTFVGMKLHLTNSSISLRDEDHVRALASVFAAANDVGLPIVVHLRTRDPDFGRDDVRTFIEEVLPCAGAVPVQVAHVGGWGGYDEATDAALGTLAEWLSSGQGRDHDVLFDLSAVVRRESTSQTEEGLAPRPDERYRRLVEKLRVIGLDRVLFGTDWPDWQPRQYLADLREHLPLTLEEVESVVANRARWVR